MSEDEKDQRAEREMRGGAVWQAVGICWAVVLVIRLVLWLFAK